MMVKKILLYSFITLIFLFLLLGLYVNTNELSQTRQELASTRIELTTTQADLALTEAKLETKDTELTLAQADLAATQTDLTKTQDELQDASSQLQDTAAKLVQTQADYTKTSQDLDSEKQRTASLQVSFKNLQANYNTLTTGVGYVLNDPTYQQMKAFLASDRTDTNPYIDDSYVCEDYSFDVKTHAMQQKMRCAYVSIRFFGDNSGHAIVAFNTTDRGIVYIEPQSDEEVNLQIGRDYWTQCVIPNPDTYYLDPPDYNDTIDRFNVIW